MAAFIFGTFAGVVQPWIQASFPIIRMVLIIVEVVLSVFLTIVVLFQSGNTEGGMGAISGGQDTFFGKNKGNTLEGRLKRMTVVTAVLLVVVAILFFISMAIYSGQ